MWPADGGAAIRPHTHRAAQHSAHAGLKVRATIRKICSLFRIVFLRQTNAKNAILQIVARQKTLKIIIFDIKNNKIFL